MRIVRVDPGTESYERAIRAIEKRLPNVRKDVERETDRLTSDQAPPIPCPPSIALIPGLGSNGTVLKIRVRSSDLTKGKSGGLRMLLLRGSNDAWRPILIYAKTMDENVSRDEILEAIKTE